jgi:lysozyme family protein
MANFGSIVEWVLRLEDRTLAGKTVNLGDGAGLTRFGITTKNCPGMPREFWESMPTEQAIELAKQFYYSKYWQPIRGTSILSDEVAATLMSFAVNDGVYSAVKLIEDVIHQDRDGVFGPNDLAAVNQAEPEQLAAALRDEQEARYQAIEARIPSDQKFDRGWRKRAYVHYPDLP